MTSNNTRFMDLFNRALSLGYDREAAAAVADVFDTVHTYDPCKLHPALSTTMDRQGYLADGCEACYVIRKTDAAGYVPGAFCADGKCGTCADCVECAEIEANDPEACKAHKGGYNIPGVAVCVGCEADGSHTMEGPVEVSGVEILADLVKLEAVPATAERDRMVKFHKLSAPMIGVITMVAESRGLVGSWAMRNVVLVQVPGATRRTLDALIKRGMVEAETNDGDASGTGGLTDYVLTDRGAEIAEILGTPIVDLPTDPAEAAALAAGKTVADCETGCERILERGVVLMPVGGDVCLGCGSIFTRPTGQLHPGLYVVSEAVSARNQQNGI